MADSIQEVRMPDGIQVAPVSVIVPCYNCDGSLERAVRSVAEQTVRPVEVILVNDASTDNTARCMEEIRQQYGQEWVRVINLSSNRGPATARNLAWEMSRQPYIAFLDADDAWRVDKIGVQYEFMRNNPGVVLSGHAYQLFKGVGAEVDSRRQGKPRYLSCRSMLISNRFATRTVMLYRNLPYRFLNGKRYCEDYQLWLEIACRGHSVVFLPQQLAYVFKADFGESGQSSRLWRMELGELGAIWSLVSAGLVNVPAATLASLYSLVKYVRRELVVELRRATKYLRQVIESR